MSRHDGIDEVIFFEPTLVFRHAGYHPGCSTDAIPLVRFMGQAHNRHVRLPEDFKDLVEGVTLHQPSFQQLCKVRVIGLYKQSWPSQDEHVEGSKLNHFSQAHSFAFEQGSQFLQFACACP